jgi:hypothetical protein
MQMTGRFTLEAPIQDVWSFLLDPGILTSCIPGAEEMKAIDDKTYVGRVKQKVGPISARFEFTTTLTEINPPRNLKAVGKGWDNGVVGPFTQEMVVNLTEISKSEVEISYEVKANMAVSVPVIGKMMMEAKARSFEKEFTKNLQEKMRAKIALLA